MKPKKLHAPTIKRTASEVTEIGGWLTARALSISNASDFIDDGRQGVDYSAIRRGGSDSTPTERSALVSRPDDVGQLAGEFMAILERWHRDARRLRVLGVKLAVDWDAAKLEAAKGVAQRSQEPAGAGDCSNCNRVVSGSRIDRLRGGRCQACDRYQIRNLGKERPRALWGGESIDDVCPNIRTHLGIDERCRLTVGHGEDCSWARLEVA